MTFAARFADLAKRAELSVDCGSLDGWTDLVSLSTDRFDIAESYIREWQAAYPGLDRRGGGAYLIGAVAYNVSGLMVVLHLSERLMPLALRVGVRLEGRDLTLRLPDDADLSPSDPLLIAETLEALLTPLIARLKTETRLGAPALWRCAADSFASAFLYAGRALGEEARTRLEALSVLAQPVLMMSNRQTGFRDVTIHCADGHEVTEGFLKRGGCCRYYTADNAEYCSTCILRPEDQQLSLLEAYLHELHEPALAAE